MSGASGTSGTSGGTTSVILHITPREQWDRARAAGEYRADTVATEGFMHSSTPGQAVAVADRLFRGRTDLVLLVIDPAKVRAEIRYEGAAGGEAYPHIYGPLNVDAVVRALPFPPGPNGRFTLPAL